MSGARLLLLALLVCAAATGAGAVRGDLDLAIGKAVFERLWIPAPASTRHADGLGPLFAARSCAACHVDGGGIAFRAGTDGPVEVPGLVYRLGDPDGAPHARYGRELQTFAAGGVAAEGAQRVDWTRLADGRVKPDWAITDPAYGPIDDVRVSARRAPPLRGVGSLAGVPDAAILSAADPDDANGDGISGRPARIAGQGGEVRVGRFGWKASEPDLGTQIASALELDLGLSSAERPVAWGDCTNLQQSCLDAPHGGSAREPEVPESLLAPLLAFVGSLAAPPSGGPGSPGRERGEAVFAALGCAACHTPRLQGSSAPVAAYTDLLLHDLGPGLDDGLREADAASAEWRTAPLWSVGEVLSRGGGLLHDGRARSIDEAIRWHDGEAYRSRAAYVALPARDRAALALFVRNVR